MKVSDKMARNKYPEITRTRILDAATKLFLENGWEETTIQDIVDELGDVTRGAFYHHFKSKNDIIDAVTTRLFMQDNPATVVKVDNQLSGLDKLKKIMLLAVTDKKQLQFMKSAPSVLKSPQLVAKQLNDCIYVISPQLQAYIEEGIHDGSINVTYPKQTAESLVILTNLWFNAVLFPVSKSEFMQKLEHFKIMFDNVGLPLIDEPFRQAFEQYYDYIIG